MSIRSIAVAAVLGLAVTACSDRATEVPAPVPQGESQATSEETGSGAADGGLASCLAFSVEALAEREWAFDGTVSEIVAPTADQAPYEVVFDVTTWYRGGQEMTTTVETYDVSGTSLTGALALEVGQRVLASGDERYLWGCGFSVTYSEEAAAMFSDTFDG